ncbi:MAG: SusC/RagA family TonB-linked outer membrane protein, partial [Balneolaceae bacterium]
PGLQISSPGADPNANPTLRLRGISSFGGSAEPLIVVDGIVGASLENIDPNDIETIDVLKDASAAAIYGTRGGAGVIAITTKKGQAGTTSVNYNGSYSMLGIENKLEVLSADEFRQLSQETGLSITDMGADTDWFDAITQQSYTQIHNLSIAGGTQSTTYRVSGNFRDNQGLLVTTGFEQLGGRINLNHRTLDDKLSLTFDLGATNREQSNGFNQAFRYAATFNPTAPTTADGFETTGGYVDINAFDMFNPLQIVKTAENLTESRRLNAALRADYQFDDLLPGLSASVFYSVETYSAATNRFWARTNKLTGGASTASLGRGQADRVARDNRREQFDVTANYFGSITDRMNVEFLAGYSFQDFESGGTDVSGGNFLSDAVGSNNLSFAQDFDRGLGNISSFKNSNRLIAGFGRISLDYDYTYFFNASIRREGSSRFGANNRWGNFWSAGAGVEITNLIDTSIFDRLRLRGSYGITGLDAPFDGISKLRFGPTGNFFVGGEFVQRFGPVSNDNPDLKWEETSEFNFGLEFSTLNERLVGTVEYYQKNTDDLILQIEVPVPPNLFPTSWVNVGEIENKGVEATLRYDVIRNPNATWNSGFTFTTFDVTLAQFESDVPRYIANVGSPGQNNTQQVRIAQGEPLGQLWGPRFAGIDPDGTWKFFNAAGERVGSDEIAREDEAIIGNGIPDFEIGWTNQVRYRNWDLGIFFRGVFGHDLINSARVFFENPSNITTYNVVKSAMDLTHLTSQPVYSSFHVEDATFVRFENLSIGYTIPLPNSSQIQRMRLSFSGRNLFTLTGYDGIDPEVRWNDGGNPLAPGIERRSQWYTGRSFTLGINLDF